MESPALLTSVKLSLTPHSGIGAYSVKELSACRTYTHLISIQKVRLFMQASGASDFLIRGDILTKREYVTKFSPA